jgi:EmrB/QacA subfamily drug resistance transporter
MTAAATARRTTTRVEYKWIVAAVFVCGMFIDILDTTIVNVALPDLGREFHASTASIEWIVLGYLLSLAVFIPASGWIGDRFGTRRVFLFALAMFTFASALCGQANSLSELVAFRVFQGVGGGMLVPVGTAMLFRAFPPIERAKASTVLIVPTVLAPALGPVLGGWLVTDVSWRWIFYVNLPVGAIAFAIGFLFLREEREGHAGRFDLPGFVLSGAGLALVLYALTQGPEKGWRAPQVLVTGVVGIVMFVLLVIVETRVPEPLLALRLFRERMFRNATVVLTLTYGSFIGVIFLMPLYLQNLRGFTPLESGLTTFPQALGVIVSSQIVGHLYHRVGPRRLIVFGMLGMAVATLPLAFIGLDTSLWEIRVIMFARGICMAFAFDATTGRRRPRRGDDGHRSRQPHQLRDRRSDRPARARSGRAERLPPRVLRRNRARRAGVVVRPAHPRRGRGLDDAVAHPRARSRAATRLTSRGVRR